MPAVLNPLKLKDLTLAYNHMMVMMMMMMMMMMMVMVMMMMMMMLQVPQAQIAAHREPELLEHMQVVSLFFQSKKDTT